MYKVFAVHMVWFLVALMWMNVELIISAKTSCNKLSAMQGQWIKQYCICLILWIDFIILTANASYFYVVIKMFCCFRFFSLMFTWYLPHNAQTVFFDVFCFRVLIAFARFMFDAAVQLWVWWVFCVNKYIIVCSPICDVHCQSRQS